MRGRLYRNHVDDSAGALHVNDSLLSSMSGVLEGAASTCLLQCSAHYARQRSRCFAIRVVLFALFVFSILRQFSEVLTFNSIGDPCLHLFRF